MPKDILHIAKFFFSIFKIKKINHHENDPTAKIAKINSPEKSWVTVVFLIKIKLRSFKSSEHIFEKGDGPYRGFGYSSLVSDPLDSATWSQRELQ